MQTLQNIALTGDDWVSINSSASIPVGKPICVQLKTNYMILLQQSSTKPDANSKTGILLSNIFKNDSTKIISSECLEIWAKCANSGETSEINVQPMDAGAILPEGQNPVHTPSEIYSGKRAVNVQFYDESNKKLGSQWEASKRITNAALNQKFYSVIKTRTLPVDLKSRFFTFTGIGVIARFYSGFTPVTLPAPEPIFSLRPGQPAFRDCDIYTLATAPTSLGTKWAADIFAEGNASNQAKGSTGDSYGSGWIIEPNQEILLEIESLSAAQNISARLELYNGLLDLPLP